MEVGKLVFTADPANWSILTPIADMFPPKSQNGMKADGDVWLSGVKI